MAESLNQRNNDEVVVLGNKPQLFNVSRTAHRESHVALVRRTSTHRQHINTIH